MAALKTLLARAASSVPNPSPAQKQIVSSLEGLRARLDEGLLRVAALGQFKRGKSTLLNALLGAPLLPAGVVPVTAIPTFIGAGGEPSARITFLNNEQPLPVFGEIEIRRALERFTSEAQNPHNRLNVGKVEIEFPSEFLAHGIQLIDTPGVGSTFLHNTQAAQAVLGECDAALFVLSADPPITEVEVGYLREVQKLIPKLFFILNKNDLLDAQERCLAEEFLAGVLKQQPTLGEGIRIFCVSGKRGLQAKLDGNLDVLAESGIGRLQDVLTEELAREKQEIVHSAARLRAISLAGDLLFQTELERKALLMPQEELRQKAIVFEESVSRFETEKRALSDFMFVDRRHLLEELDTRVDRLWKEAQGEMRQLLEDISAQRIAAKEARDLIGTALSRSFEDAFPKVIELFKTKLSERLGAHRQRADALLNLVRQTAANLMEISVSLPRSEEAFEIKRAPYWVTPEASVSLLALSSGALTRFLPESLRERRLYWTLSAQAERAILRNIANLDWAMRQNIEDAFRDFESALSEQVEKALQATREALQLALDRHAAKSQEIGVYVREAERSVASLSEILAELQDQDSV